MNEAKEIFSFILKHADLIKLLADAVQGGVQHEHLLTAIKREMTLASDALARVEME